jgi:NAD(P)H-hydrate epimerase
MNKPSLDARLFQVVDIKQIAQRAHKEQSLTTGILMGRAAQAAFDSIVHHYPHTDELAVFCGSGANGADGLYFAAIAALAGKSIRCFFMADLDKLSEKQQKAHKMAGDAGVVFSTYDNVIFDDTDMVVDALLGLGCQGELSEELQVIVDVINQSKKIICSLDIPTGLNANTGAAAANGIQADLTISFIAPKIGCYMFRGPRVCGKLITNHLGIEPHIIEEQSPVATLLSERFIRQSLPKRKKDSHKDDYGHVLVIGGDYGMGGAVRMAAEAAMRTGAGSVTVATRPEHLNVVSGARPEIMCYEVRCGADLEHLIEKSKVIILGPGLGRTEWAKSLFDTVIQSDVPKIMDADALRLLSENPIKRDDWILTPHPGEAAELLRHSCPDIQGHRLQSLKEIQMLYGGVAVLKGHGTLVGDGKEVRLCHAGNPGMATAGMGDILSGVLGGLVAQGLTLPQSAGVGVLVHARSADMAAQEMGERGLLATDLLPYLRVLVNP